MRPALPDAERWEMLQTLFHRACALPPASREAFVRSEAVDAELADQVLAMISHAEATGQGVHGDVARSASHWDQPHDRSGERVGPYRLTSRIRFGGMAEVYEAVRDDGAFERTVALKIIRGDRPASRLHALFHQERGRLARFEHANIAFVFDGGDTESGEPYFVMERLQGMPFVDACHTKNLSWPEVLGHMLDLCKAVAHSHQHLIIHRDIKPENVMLADTPAGRRIKLLDFGIAEVLHADGAADSQLTEVWYSPSFAAPEVIRGERGTQATDVYSLGRLFGLLDVLCPVGQKAEFRAVREHACAAGSEDRYPTVAALSADLRRLRDRAPISIWSGRRLYVVRRRLRRHALAGLIVLLGVLAALVAIRYERGLRLAAEQSAAAALSERDRSVAIRDFLLASYDSANPVLNRGEELRVADVLDQQSGQLQANVDMDRDVRVDLLLAMGNAQLNLGRDEQARLTYEAALSLSASGTTILPRFNALVALAQIARQRDDFEHAEAYFREAESLLATLPIGTPETTDAIISYSSSWSTMLHRQDRFDDAERVVRTGLAAAEAAGDDPKMVARRVRMLLTLGAVYSSRGELEQALETFRLGHRLNVEHSLSHTFGHLGVLGWLGITLDRVGDSRASEPYLREAVEVAEQLFPEPNIRLSSAYGNLGAFLLFNGRLSEAEPWLRHGIEVLEQMGDRRSVTYQARLHNLGMLALEREDVETAERLLGESYHLRVTALGAEHTKTAAAEVSLATLAVMRERWVEAERLSRHAIAALEGGSEGGHTSLPAAMYAQALALAELGRRSEALAVASRAETWVATRQPNSATFAASNAMFQAQFAWASGDLDLAHRKAMEAGGTWRSPQVENPLAAARAELLRLRIERTRGRTMDTAQLLAWQGDLAVLERELVETGPTRRYVRDLATGPATGNRSGASP